MDSIEAKVIANTIKKTTRFICGILQVKPLRLHDIAREIRVAIKKDMKIQKKHIPTSSQILENFHKFFISNRSLPQKWDLASLGGRGKGIFATEWGCIYYRRLTFARSSKWLLSTNSNPSDI